MNNYIGWDIGGAHLKAACLNGAGKMVASIQCPCPLWRGVDKLITAFPQAYTAMNVPTNHTIYHAVTMTGEMADCFDSRYEGVTKILTIIGNLLQQPFWVYAGNQGLVDNVVARKMPMAVASSNWHATATCAAAYLAQGVLIDIGSTTTDLAPFSDGKVLEVASTKDWNDRARLMSGTLVYTGVVRTPIMAIASAAEINGRQFPIVAEHFANAADMYRLLKKLPADADQYPSCDGKGKNITESISRFARMFGDDFSGSPDIWLRLAEHIANQQQIKIVHAYRDLCAKYRLNHTTLVGAGVGNFLVKEIASISAAPYLDFATLYAAKDHHATDYASALALAWMLYRKYCNDRLKRIL